MTQTSSAFERMLFGSVALSRWVPDVSSCSHAVPLVVVAPPTVAPLISAPVRPSLTLTGNGTPGAAVAGPVSFRAWALPKPSIA